MKKKTVERFLGILLGILGASLSGNLSAGKGVHVGDGDIWSGDGTIRPWQELYAASSFY